MCRNANSLLGKGWKVSAAACSAVMLSSRGRHGLNQPFRNSFNFNIQKERLMWGGVERLLHMFCRSEIAVWFSLSCVVIHQVLPVQKNHFSYNMRLNRLWMTVLCGSEEANVLLHASVESGLWPVSSISNEIILILGQQQDFLLNILVSWFQLSSWSSHFLNLRQCVLSNALAKIVVVMYSMRTVLLQVVY